MLFFNAKKKIEPQEQEKPAAAVVTTAQGKKISLKTRRPDEFKASAEATLGNNLVRWRANERAEEERRNSEPGTLQQDGTVIAGVDPETGRKIFAAPQDERIQLDFNAAAEHVKNLNKKKYLGHDDWELPSRAALEVLYDNRQKGALAGTFEEDMQGNTRSAFYWSAAPYDNTTAYGRWFVDGKEYNLYKDGKRSVRVVRSPRS